MGVGGCFVDLAGTTGSEHHCFCLEDVDLTGGEVVGDNTGRGDFFAHGDISSGEVVVNNEVKDVELVEELHVLFHAVLVKGLQNHVPGAVCCVAGTPDCGFSVVSGVATKTPLVDAPLGGAVEG